jgi:hypothetical protein
MPTGYFDEGSDHRVFLIGGWLADAAEWEKFSEAWTSELTATPSIKYFKNNDAMGLKGEFKGWTEQNRDEKLLSLARIIVRHDLTGLVGGVGLDKVENLFSGSTLPRKTLRSIIKRTEPYHFACMGVIAVTLGYQVEEAKNLTDQVDFIFDEGVKYLDDCVESYPRLKSVLPAKAGAIAGTVGSANDRTTPALQAADMLVGQALLTMRTGKDSACVDILVAKKIRQFNCLRVPPASIPKTMERMNKVWAMKQSLKKKKSQR